MRLHGRGQCTTPGGFLGPCSVRVASRLLFIHYSVFPCICSQRAVPKEVGIPPCLYPGYPWTCSESSPIITQHISMYLYSRCIHTAYFHVFALKVYLCIRTAYFHAFVPSTHAFAQQISMRLCAAYPITFTRLSSHSVFPPRRLYGARGGAYRRRWASRPTAAPRP